MTMLKTQKLGVASGEGSSTPRPVRDYGWNRPADWPPGPPDNFPDNTCYILYRVFDAAPLHCMWRASTTGAGSVPTAQGVQCTLRQALPDTPPESSPVFQTLLFAGGSSEFDVDYVGVPGEGVDGAKYFWAKWEINPANLAVNPNAYFNQFGHLLNVRDPGERVMGLEVWMRAEKAGNTSLGWSTLAEARAFNWKGPNLQTSTYRVLNNAYSLEYFEIDLSSVTNCERFLAYNYGLRDISALLDLSGCTTIAGLLLECGALRRLPNIVWPAASCIYTNAFDGLFSLEGIAAIDVANCSSDTLTVTRWYAAQGLRLAGAAGNTAIRTINLSNAGQMTCAAITTLIGDLADRTGMDAGTITLTGSDGIARGTQNEKDALTATGAAKNWTVVLP